MRQEIEILLRNKGYFPMTSPLWNSFEFNQVKPVDDREKITNINKIESHVPAKKGVYVYINQQEEVLYVGKGSPIKKRVKSHYEKLSKSNTNKRIAFFQDNMGIVNIYWVEIEEQEERELVEYLLVYLLKPKYRKWICV